MKNTFRNLTVLLSMLILITVGFITYKVKESNRLDKKFESTNLNLTMSQIKTSWGIPDSEFKHDGNQLLKYSDCIGWGNYIFVFDNKTNKLIGKFFDD